MKWRFICALTQARSHTHVRNARNHLHSSSLRKHIRGQGDQKPYPCLLLNKSCSKKPYTCSLCNTSFTLSYSLKTHMRLHTKEKPFKCDLCGQPFAVKSNLTRHMCSHTGEKRFSCVMCNKLFSRNSDMKYHMRTHTVNPKKYRKRKWRGEEYHRWLQIFLAMWSNWHGRKPATCSLCSQILSQSVILKCHMLASEQQFACSQCSRKYPQKPCSKQPVQNHNSVKRGIFSPQTNSFHKHIGKRNHSGVLCATK